MSTITRRVALAFALSGTVLAQEPLSALRVPIHTAEADNGVAYGTWAAGHSYKASFHDGMTFVPYLGAEYPHNQPWSWTTMSARVGSTDLLESGVSPAHAHGDYRYEYRHAAVTEAYDVHMHGLEQTFVVSQRPASGDLVVTGRVTSHLSCGVAPPRHQLLTFFDVEGRAIVRYGAAVAFDAHGDRVLVETAHSGGVITLTVPGAWFARAALPVTIDPLLTRVTLTSGVAGNSVGEVDVGREDETPTANNLICYTRSASQFDEDVLVSVRDDGWVNGHTAFSDITSAWDSDGVACAFVGGADKWAIVFRRYFGTSPIRVSNIRCHVRQRGSVVFSSLVGTMFPPTGFNDWRVDVGGVQSYESGTDALVVFQREDNTNTAGHWQNNSNSKIYCSVLDVTTALGNFGPAKFIYGASGSRDAERPSVNQISEGGNNLVWVCALQHINRNVSGDDWDVIASRINRFGNRAMIDWWSDVAALNTHHQLAPTVAGSDGRYAVAFSTVDIASTPSTNGTRGKQLRVERFDWPSSANSPSSPIPPMVVLSNASAIWEATNIAFDANDRSHFAIACRSVAPGVPGAFGLRVGYRGQVTEGPLVLQTGGGGSTSDIAVAFDRENDEFLFAYGWRGVSLEPLYGHTLQYSTPAAWSNAGVSCTNTVLSWVGNQQIGAEFNGVQAAAAPTGAGHFLIVSLGTANQTVVDPGVTAGCRLLVDITGSGFLGTMAFQTGANPFWSLALPEWLPPMTLHFQDWILNGSQFESSRRLSVPLVK